jgi:hypothetical protein
MGGHTVSTTVIKACLPTVIPRQIRPTAVGCRPMDTGQREQIGARRTIERGRKQEAGRMTAISGRSRSQYRYLGTKLRRHRSQAEIVSRYWITHVTAMPPAPGALARRVYPRRSEMRWASPCAPLV